MQFDAESWLPNKVSKLEKKASEIKETSTSVEENQGFFGTEIVLKCRENLASLRERK